MLMLNFLWWLLIVEAIGLAAFPLAYYLLKRLPDRGFSVSKPLGILILGSHFGGRYWLESAEEKESLLSRGYLVFVTVTFGIITIVFLPQAVSETFEYILDDPVGMYDDDRSGPGGKLALSITTLPIWLIYLSAVIRTMRRKSI